MDTLELKVKFGRSMCLLAGNTYQVVEVFILNRFVDRLLLFPLSLLNQWIFNLRLNSQMPWFLEYADIIPALRSYLLMKQKIGGKKATLELFNDKYLRGVTSKEVLISSYDHLVVHIC